MQILQTKQNISLVIIKEEINYSTKIGQVK